MKTYFKEYGWLRTDFGTWFRALIHCKKGIHDWVSLGGNHFRYTGCNSDNCFICRNCKFQTHD